MKKSAEMLRLEKDLAADRELQRKMDEAVKEAAGSGTCACDGEVFSEAARALGYDIPPSELERMHAEIETLDLEEMEQVSGGEDDDDYAYCEAIDMVPYEDEYGHDSFCLAAWHCATVILHTGTESHKVMCWSNYLCFTFSKKY